MPLAPTVGGPQRVIGPSKGTTLTQFNAAASAALGGPQWLARQRAEAFERFEGMSFPAESEEIWRYSGVDGFDIGSFAPVDGLPRQGSSSSDLALAESLARLLGPRSALVVTRDGFVRGVRLEPGLAAGSVEVNAARSEEADRQKPHGLGELAPPHDAFGELHEAFLADAALVTVAPKVVVADPVVVVHLVGFAASGPSAPEAGAGMSCFPRSLVRVGRSAEARVIELFARVGSGAPVAGGGGPRSAGVAGDTSSNVTDEGAALVVPVTELEVGEDAHLHYANLQLLDRSSTQIAVQASRVQSHGSLSSFAIGLGGHYARVRTDSDLAGQGAESFLLAAYFGSGEQVHDFRTLQDHHGPRTRSELLFTGAVADRARSVYSGLIRIERGAHGADAYQTNHNLVLSEGAHADSVPNLDIDENDVRCSHASTIGPINEDQRYYLESRGIEPSVAERLIVLGFFSDVAARAPFEGVGRFLREEVGRRLSGRLPADLAADSAAPTQGGGGG
jgi:Fe-S cluster assembly protein SufD